MHNFFSLSLSCLIGFSRDYEEILNQLQTMRNLILICLFITLNIQIGNAQSRQYFSEDESKDAMILEM